MSGSADLNVTTSSYPTFPVNELYGGQVDTDTEREVERAMLAAKIFPVVFLLAGIVGNVVTAVALCKREELSAGCRVYHLVLCLLDLCVLFFSTLRFWLLALVPVDLSSVIPNFCKVWPWLEYSVLMAPLWILVAMIMQVQEGLRKTYSPGVNINRWKSLVYSGSAVFISLVFNCVRIFMFSPDPHETDQSEDSTYRERDTSLRLSNKNVCSPTSRSVSFFVNNVWPWLSLCASLLVPLIVMAVALVVVMRCLFQNCKRGEPRQPSPAQFVTLTASAVVLVCFSLVTSFLLCGLCLWDPTLFWADYRMMFDVPERGVGVACTFWLIFYVQFAGRWFATCCACRLWAVVVKMCRRSRPR